MKGEALADYIEQAIDDSIDVDWNSRVAANYIAELLETDGFVIVPKELSDDQAARLYNNNRGTFYSIEDAKRAYREALVCALNQPGPRAMITAAEDEG